ncbi:MAG: response regulator [Planctomycetota bacterium]|nr:response regulator [Planctomycetota bacterium]MCX8040188.1 response regulator [Planctomycetota bacterium]MDW8372517.1 response regulator [Planctomycetota bacterium]
MAPARHIVLIADDDRLVRESLSDAFDGLGWGVRTAACGREAIGLLERDRCDLLMSDIDMPDMTGFQLLDWARVHPPTPAVVLMSARAEPALWEAARRDGAIALLPKPIAFSAVRRVVAQWFA